MGTSRADVDDQERTFGWLAAAVVVALLIAGSRFTRKVWTGWQLGHRHRFKGTATGFHAYANDHHGRYPEHTNGFGDALLMLVRSNHRDASRVCGPNDDGGTFLADLANGPDVPKELCSRVYVQGLSADLPKSVCMMYDRKSFPGGDHGYGWGKPVREYIDNTGIMGTITSPFKNFSFRSSEREFAHISPKIGADLRRLPHSLTGCYG